MASHMRLSRTFPRCIFDSETLRKAITLFAELMGGTEDQSPPSRTLRNGDDRWSFDSDEEFLSAYAQDFTWGHYRWQRYDGGLLASKRRYGRGGDRGVGRWV
jgi:hypothetical protein